MIIKESRHEITEKEDKIVEKFSIGHYNITYIQHKNNNNEVYRKQICIRVKNKENEYIPIIYDETDTLTDNIIRFSIQTTSYGALTVSEIDKWLEALTEARYVANVLNKRYAKGE